MAADTPDESVAPDGASPDPVVALLEQAVAGDRRALARLISLIERGGRRAHQVGRLAYPRSGGGYVVGLTGAPGSGKSTLTNALLCVVRRRSERVAVLAVDPSSPYTGGAILGDRVRMGDHVLDDGVFIRSMATRGHLGGLSLAAPEVIRLLDAVGFGWIVVETVGVGQVEVEVAGAADTTVVVVNPGWGDAVQANKAGLMEIGDVFVVNKADRDGAQQTVRDLQGMLDLSDRGAWRPPVLATTATAGPDGDGVEDLWDAVAAHRRHLEADGELAERRAERLHRELDRVVTERIRARIDGLLGHDHRRQIERQVTAGELDPWSAADQLLAPLGPQDSPAP